MLGSAAARRDEACDTVNNSGTNERR